MSAASGADLASYLTARREEVDAALERVLPPPGARPEDLVAAMRYSTLAGGKRLRPVLVLAVVEASADERAAPIPPRAELAEAAAALELFHTYSLVHDDLPAMDDDALRRGKPTCHVVFGEATALLAGDTLQTLGFQILATRPRGEAWAARRAEAVALAADAIGLDGMAGGQALDLALTGSGNRADVASAKETLVEVHSKKTGRLIQAACELGAVYALPGERDPAARARAGAYGAALGLLFQIADDLLDVTGEAGTLGKTAGKDAAQAKLTYPAVYGFAGAVAERERALALAKDAAARLGDPHGVLGALAEFAAHRTS